MKSMDALTPELRVELKRQLGDRRLDGTAIVELLTDAESDAPVLGLTLGVIGDRAFTFIIDRGPVIEQIRTKVAIAERKLRDVDDEDDE
jgi:hypothetical protein